MENTQSKDDLQKLIEILRQELAQLYLKKGSLVHPAVLQMRISKTNAEFRKMIK
ncbi:hypothetical protein P615_12600 [Brevibacillus laterosporus PE36]|nr:Spo0E family sporulation regulatory protein-aspartic acid phosphatase [Brevibacillus laterosporus]ERM19619.1 hypothetical protein P615_12600 [Brevibacillus laterosporus PE36]